LPLDVTPLTEMANPFLKRIATVVPKSPNEMSLLRRRLTTAGYRSLNAVIFFSAAKLVCPVVAATATLWGAGFGRGWAIAGLAALLGVMLPDFWLARESKRRQKVIRNGLPDALDLLIVCLEAGSSLDQAVVKASDELEIAYPALAEELRLVTTEIRAGKPRLEALNNFAVRTRVDDVRALVAMLVQTDRFGTSVAQALRTHAETSRTKRRQNAEERAAKLSVKLVFPLVFFLFPALYVVILGPAVIKLMRVFLAHGVSESFR
jgi:tight adherence protein C